MQAFFDPEDDSPKIKIKIRGDKRRQHKTITALLDTGHTGSLALPVLSLIDIGATVESFGPVGLADGSRVNMYYFKVYVEIDGVEKQIQASMIDNPNINEAIAGLELLDSHIALIDFKNKNIVLTTEEMLVKSLESKIPKEKLDE
jgi:predicted aspartyl protease